MKPTALTLALLVSGVAMASKPLSVGSLPESDFADAEFPTNVSLAAAVTCAAGDNVRFFDIELLLGFNSDPWVKAL